MRTTLLKFVLLFSLVLLNTSLSTGQIQYNNIRFKQLSIAEGLPHNTINAITQDNHGFIWFGTRNGLNKFNGNSFEVYWNHADDPHSISSNIINCMAEDAEGNLALMTPEKNMPAGAEIC